MAVTRLVNGTHEVETAWWTFAVIGVVIAIDASRATVLWRARDALPEPGARRELVPLRE